MPPLKLLSQTSLGCSRWAYRAPLAALRSLPNARSRLPSQPGYSTKQDKHARKPTLSDALRHCKNEDNTLLSPVHVPENRSGLLNERHPAASVLFKSGIVVQRELELMNVMLGFEQANKYVILDPQGNHIGFIAEQDNSIGMTMARQMFSTHRSFTAHIFDKHENEVLRFHRPFSWISSRIGVYDPVGAEKGANSTSQDIAKSTAKLPSSEVNQRAAQVSPHSLSQMPIIGEVHQQWAPLRRKYNLFLHHQAPNAETAIDTHPSALTGLHQSLPQQLQVSQGAPESSASGYSQFAYVDEPFLSWDFSLRSANSRLIGSVNRNWGGVGRELFTDTGVYALRMDAASFEEVSPLPGPSDGRTGIIMQEKEDQGMTLDQRAVMLAAAVSIDFDYFSRHSGAGGGMGWMPLWFTTGGGEAAAAGEVAEGAGAVGEAAEGSVIRDANLEESRNAGVGAAAGMGTMAGYEAMQSDSERSGADHASPAQDRWPDPNAAVPRNRGERTEGDGVGSDLPDDDDSFADDGDFFDGF